MCILPTRLQGLLWKGLFVDMLMEFFDEKLGKPSLVLFNRTFMF
jgi:hypothetical protein